MPAFRPDPEKLTPQEELGGGIKEGWRDEPGTLFAEPEQMTDPNRHKAPSRPRHSRRGGRAYPQPSDSESDPHNKGMDRWHTPEESAAIDQGVKRVSRELAKTQAEQDAPEAQFDHVRRGQLAWAADNVTRMVQAEGAAHVLEDPTHDAYARVAPYYRDAEQARATADRLRKEAEHLVDAACPNCPFYERCALVGLSMHTVAALEDSDVRKRFEKEMEAPYGSPLVSCEYVLPSDSGNKTSSVAE